MYTYIYIYIYYMYIYICAVDDQLPPLPTGGDDVAVLRGPKKALNPKPSTLRPKPSPT